VASDPDSPSLKVIAAVTFLLGLFGAIFIAFIRHSAKSPKEF
jgi:uncharacterized protein involved in exopolysaccharide biosynthesis